MPNDPNWQTNLQVKRSPAQWAALVEAQDRATLSEVAGLLRLLERGIIKPGECVVRIQDKVNK